MLELETVLMTIYYPTHVGNWRPGDQTRKFSRELWLGRPRMGMAEGYGIFAGVGKLAVPLFIPTMFTKLPAFRNAPLASHWAPPMDMKTEGFQVKMQTGARPIGAPESPTFPMIMFSHGLGGTRTMYSSVCGEFASYGFVVCAVEHRDGSGPRTYVNHARSGLASMAEREQNGGVDHNAQEHAQGYDIIDYLFPKDNPRDTAPNNPKGVDDELRHAQIDLRLAEIEEAYAVMTELCEGKGESVSERNLRRAGFKGSSSHGLQGVDWKSWKDRIRLDHVTAAGHSFGAATVVEMIRRDERFHYVSQGIFYDVWGAGTLPPDSEPSQKRISRPVLAINSEAFTYWPSNFDLVESLVNEAQSEPSPKPSWLLTLRGTVHVSQSDFSILYPHISSLVLKMAANPKRALDLNINASLEFLSQVLPEELSQVNRAYQNEGLLEAPINLLDKIPSAHKLKPNDKWMAARLRIRHEWLFRVSPKLYRKAIREEDKRKGRAVETGDEVWVHIKPSAETLAKHLEDKEKPAERQGKVEDAMPRAQTSAGDEDGTV